MSKLLNFYIDEQIHKELKILAARENRSITEILNELSIEYVKIHKEGNPQHLITNFMTNGQFIGFPSIAIDIDKKKIYAINMEQNLIPELYRHICEWKGIIKRL